MDYRLPRKVLILWRIYASAIAVVLISIFSIPFLFLKIMAVISISVIILLWVLTVFLYLPALFKRARVIISDKSIYCSQGFFFHCEYYFPANRVVVAERISLPISGSMGLCYVCIKYVGHILVLPPLTKEAAIKMSRIIMMGKNDE